MFHPPALSTHFCNLQQQAREEWELWVFMLKHERCIVFNTLQIFRQHSWGPGDVRQWWEDWSGADPGSNPLHCAQRRGEFNLISGFSADWNMKQSKFALWKIPFQKVCSLCTEQASVTGSHLEDFQMYFLRCDRLLMPWSQMESDGLCRWFVIEYNLMRASADKKK